MNFTVSSVRPSPGETLIRRVASPLRWGLIFLLLLSTADAAALGVPVFPAHADLPEGLFFGALLVMWVYNFSLLIYLKEKSYLFYIYYLGGFIASFLYIDGFMPLIVGTSVFKEHVFDTFPFFALHGMIVFGRNFLNLKESRTALSRYLLLSQYIVLLAVVSPFLLPRGQSWGLIHSLIVLITPVLVYAAMMQSRKGYKGAACYLWGWVFFTVSIGLLAFKSRLPIPESCLTDYWAKFASMWAAVVFSFALAFRLRCNEQEVKQQVAATVEELKAALECERQALKRNVQFIAAVNHELRSPLQNLIGAYEMVFAESGFDESDPRVVSLRRVAQQIVVQMRDIGDFSRLEAAVLVPRVVAFRVEDVLDGIADDFKEDFRKKSISLILKTPGDDEIYYADRDRIRQVIVNLVQNAIKFTEAGCVEVRHAVLVPADSSPAHNRLIEFSVCDTGRGIPADEIKNIFDPFWQGNTKQKNLGSGLGLAIVKKLIDLLGGMIAVDSVEGIGTTFTVTFPVLMCLADDT